MRSLAALYGRRCGGDRRRCRAAGLAVQQVDAGGQIVDARAERGHRAREGVEAVGERLVTPLVFERALFGASLRLRGERFRLGARTLGGLIDGGEVGADLIEIRLGGGAGHVGHARTAAEKQRGEQEEAPSARRAISRSRA